MQKIPLILYITAIILIVESRIVEIRLGLFSGLVDLKIGQNSLERISTSVPSEFKTLMVDLPENEYVPVSMSVKVNGPYRGLMAAFYTTDGKLIGFTSANSGWRAATLTKVNFPITQTCKPSEIPESARNLSMPVTDTPGQDQVPQWIWPNKCYDARVDYYNYLEEVWLVYNLYVPACSPYGNPNQINVKNERAQIRYHMPHQHESKFHLPMLVAGVFLGFILVAICEAYAHVRMKMSVRDRQEARRFKL